MSVLETSTANGAASLTNGSGAAAVLAAGIGSFVLAILAIAAYKITSIKGLMAFYKLTGPLSGVTTIAILIWLFTWGILEWRWRNRTVAARLTNTIALIMLGFSLLLTFPPIADFF